MVLLLLQGCATFTSPWSPQKNSATKQSHQEVMKELDSNFHREPASALNELNVDFTDLRKVSPGKFEVYLFPKVSSQTSKESLHKDIYLGPPKVFEVSIQVVGHCRQFISEGLFSKYKPSEAFPKELGSDSQRFCAIMEISDKRLSNIDKALLKQDDQLSVRLFIDDSYRIHAVDHILFETRNKNRLVRRVSEQETFTSGLSFFPMDLPTSASVSRKTELESHFSKKLDPIAKHQIQKRYSSSFSAPRCEGVVFTSKDPLGGNSEVGWCRGIPWPSYSENRRFFSVTQPLRVR